MISLPPLTGVILGGLAWVHVPLLLLWWIGYFFFQAAMLWLKSRRKARYFPPVRAYGLATIPFAVVLLAMQPALLGWAIVYGPLVAIAVRCVLTRRERSMTNDTVTVLAACLMLPVAFHAGADHGDVRWNWAWLVFLVQFAYFWGTVPHVKALIRERQNPAFARLSLAYHGLVAAIVAVLSAFGVFATTPLGGWLLVSLWVTLTLRAWAMPAWQRRGHRIRPMVIGLVEVFFSLAVTLTLVL